MSLMLNSAAWLLEVFSSIALRILRQTLHFVLPCLAGVPLAFTFDLDPGSINQKEQRPFEPR